MRRWVIIGMDGVPYNLLLDLCEKGVMENTSRILADSFHTSLNSTLPEVSSVAWSSIITGKNPGEHGIFGFMELDPSSYRIYFPSFRDLKSPPFWEKIEGESIVVNVPSTYPVKEMRGVHISGFVSVEFEKSVYPPSLLPRLKEMDYRLDVDSQLAHKSLSLFLEDLFKTLEARIKAYRFLWEFMDWDIFFLVFTGTDRLLHFLWSAYEEEKNPYHGDFLEYFRRIDEIIGEVYHRLSTKDVLLIISDHGFERLERDVFVNTLLEREGFLVWDGEASWERISPSTRAFSLDPARIYIHEEGRFLRGGVKERDREAIIKDLMALLSEWEIEGRKIIRKVYRKEEIYQGPYVDRAPDLILVGEKGINLRSRITEKLVDENGIFTGKHSSELAIFVLHNSSLPENPLSVEEIGKIVSLL